MKKRSNEKSSKNQNKKAKNELHKYELIIDNLITSGPESFQASLMLKMPLIDIFTWLISDKKSEKFINYHKFLSNALTITDNRLLFLSSIERLDFKVAKFFLESKIINVNDEIYEDDATILLHVVNKHWRYNSVCKIVQFLLENGADVNKINSSKHNVFDMLNYREVPGLQDLLEPYKSQLKKDVNSQENNTNQVNASQLDNYEEISKKFEFLISSKKYTSSIKELINMHNHPQFKYTEQVKNFVQCAMNKMEIANNFIFLYSKLQKSLTNSEKSDILTFAITLNKKAIFEMLINDLNLDINLSNSSGYTPIKVAYECDNKEMMQLLLNKGADLSDINDELKSFGLEAIVKDNIANSSVFSTQLLLDLTGDDKTDIKESGHTPEDNDSNY